MWTTNACIKALISDEYKEFNSESRKVPHPVTSTLQATYSSQVSVFRHLALSSSLKSTKLWALIYRTPKITEMIHVNAG
jgi:hypothetical protein